MTRLLELGIISLTMSLSFLLVRLVTISFGFVLISFAASTKQYEVGNLYNYDYVLKLEMNEPVGVGSSEGSTVGYKIISKVQVTPIWTSEGGGSILEILVTSKIGI